MAQKTALSVMGTPGRTQSFIAKTTAVIPIKVEIVLEITRKAEIVLEITRKAEIVLEI